MPRFLALVATALLVLGANAPDSTRSVDVGGLTFQAPESWQKVTPKSAMRRAQLVVKAVEPDTDPAELVVFVFPGGAGSVEDNIKRWQSQFKDANGQPPRIESRVVKGKNVDVTRVECAGTFTDALNRIGPKPGYHLLGAIVVTPEAGYFFKLVGPEKTVTSIRDAFDRLIASMAKPAA